MIVMGSDSDLPVLKGCIKFLKNFQINTEIMVCSAHRSPDKASQLAKNAESNGFDVIIAAAGKAAHLPGVLAAYTVLPVIGIPINSEPFDGLDSLLSIVQMPQGIPVATVAVDGAENAAILAAQILSVGFPDIRNKIRDYKSNLNKMVEEKNERLQIAIKDI
jgi:5-(carboxyamino)imidazole ribonucleotide mutase